MIVLYQLGLLISGIVAMFKGGNWEAFMAASIVCGAIVHAVKDIKGE